MMMTFGLSGLSDAVAGGEINTTHIAARRPPVGHRVRPKRRMASMDFIDGRSLVLCRSAVRDKRQGNEGWTLRIAVNAHRGRRRDLRRVPTVLVEAIDGDA